MKILGIDIGNGLATCCPLECVPDEPREFNIDGANFYSFKADITGINGILALNPDIAILEPTGTNYSKLWATYLGLAGVEVRFVAHHRLKAQRNDLDLPDKDDEADSFALAYYGIKNLDNPLKFVQTRTTEMVKLKEICLRLDHLNRCQSPIINRLRQDLAWQFPERSTKRVERSNSMTNPPGFYRWLAGEIKSKIYEKEYSESIGLGLTDSVRDHAKRLCDLHREEIKLEILAKEILLKPDYKLYHSVFNAFGFGTRTQSVLLSQIFPFEGFLDENNKQIILFKKGKNSKKITKRYISRRRFEKMLGTAPTRNSSGQKDVRQVIGGSVLCRNLLTNHVANKCSSKIPITYNPIKEAIRIWKNNPKRSKSKKSHSCMNATCFLVRLLFKAIYSFLHNETPDLISYEVVKHSNYNECSFCGAKIETHCDHCDELRKKVKLHFQSFLI